MMGRRIWELVGITLLIGACASTGGSPMSPAETCVREGARWIAVLEYCEILK